MKIDMPLDRSELPDARRPASLLRPFVGGAAGKRQESDQIAQHGFAERIGQERKLRVGGVERGAEQRAEGEAAGSRNGRWSRPRPITGESAACGMTSGPKAAPSLASASKRNSVALRQKSPASSAGATGVLFGPAFQSAGLQ